MYNGQFKKALTPDGDYYRDQQSGDLIEHCSHSFVVYPFYKIEEKFYAGDIIVDAVKVFAGLKGCCRYCGESITIFKGDMVTENEYVERIGNEAVKACGK